MSLPDDLPIVAEAEWLYDGTVPIRIRLISSPQYFGTGDYEDAPDIAEDRVGQFYMLAYESASSPGRFNNMIRNLESIDAAMAEAERRFPGLRWLSKIGD